MSTKTNTLIIGASAAGLASAACLEKKGIEYIVLEKYPQVAMNWRNHYERLHLHTSKKWSSLPYKNFGTSVPRYPARRQVVEYLEGYAGELKIHPVFETAATNVKREANLWMTETTNGNYCSENLVIATGLNHTPSLARWEGIDSFEGTILHSSRYKNGKAFSGKNVLIVGFGNSACELAICLYEHGAFPALSVRSGVNVLPRDIFGLPVLEVGKLTSFLPPRIADKVNAPLLKLLVGNLTALGLKKARFGPLEQIEKQKKIPLLDIGTIALIREGNIKVFGDIRKIGGSVVHFEDNRQQSFDTIIQATGYHHNLESFLPADYIRKDVLDFPFRKQPDFGKDGLYFCGFYLSPRGMLREIGIEAHRIAQAISGR